MMIRFPASARSLPFSVALVALVGLAATACGGDDDADDGGTTSGGSSAMASGGSSTASKEEQAAALTGDAASGMTAYGTSCGRSTCHGDDGDSGPAPNHSVVIPLLDDAGLLRVIANGTGSMPAQSQLSAQEMADVVAYLRATF